jgi:AraC family transcriptional regulator
MISFRSAMLTNAASAPSVDGGSTALCRIVEDEPAWRALPDARRGGVANGRVIPTRWHSLDHHAQEVRAETPVDSHLVAIVLRNENVCLSLAGHTIHDGAVIAGMIQVTEPAVSASCTFRGTYDVLHLHVPNCLIADTGHGMTGREPTGLCSGAAPFPDPVVGRLGRALLAVEEIGGSFGWLYADCVSMAIVARLLALSRGSDFSVQPRVSKLVPWRLRRVMEYVEANLAEPLSLAELASAAGLTRMHFAAQFRAATGLSPHQYLLRRRIECAQEALAEDAISLADIALSVGFQNQSHFTHVFKRFVGGTPHAWRQSRIGSCVSTKERCTSRRGAPDHRQVAA